MKHKVITQTTAKNIRSFWKWFTQNEHILRQALTARNYEDPVWNSFKSKLWTISNKIGYQMANPIDGTSATLIFTAQGNRKLLPKIDAIIAGFPGISKWQVQALIQPEVNLESYIAGTDQPCVFPDFELYVSQMMFQAIDYDTIKRNTALTVFLPNYQYHYDNPTLPQAVDMIIENLVGEMAYYRNISQIELAQIPDDTAGLLPVYKLPEILQQLRLINRQTNRSINKLIGNK